MSLSRLVSSGRFLWNEVENYSEGIFALQIVKKMLKKTIQFLSSEQPCESKRLDVALHIAMLKEYAWKTCGCGQHWRPFDSSFEY